MQYKHIKQEALVFRVEAHVWHIKCSGHHHLSNSNRHSHHKSINCHYPTWIFGILVSILECGIAEEYTKQILMHRILGCKIGQPPKVSKTDEILEFCLQKVGHIDNLNLLDLPLSVKMLKLLLVIRIEKIGIKACRGLWRRWCLWLSR